MSHFHDAIDVLIPGQLLTALIDETISLESVSSNGLLMGNRDECRSQRSVDNNEDIYEIKHDIQITNYLNFRSNYGIWEDSNNIKDFSNVSDDSDIVGLLVLQNYNNNALPSFKDIQAASLLYKKECIRSSKPSIPFIILIISIPSNQDGWIYSIKYTCYIFNGESNTLSSIQMKIPSLSADSEADYVVAKCLNRSIKTVMPNISSLSIQKSTSLELSANNMLDNICEKLKETVDLENDVIELKKLSK